VCGYSEIHGVIGSRFRKSSDLVRESEVFVKNETGVENAEWVVVSQQPCILESCCLSPIRRNSVLEELRMRRSAVFRKRSVVEHFVSE